MREFIFIATLLINSTSYMVLAQNTQIDAIPFYGIGGLDRIENFEHYHQNSFEHHHQNKTDTYLLFDFECSEADCKTVISDPDGLASLLVAQSMLQREYLCSSDAMFDSPVPQWKEIIAPFYIQKLLRMKHQCQYNLETFYGPKKRPTPAQNRTCIKDDRIFIEQNRNNQIICRGGERFEDFCERLDQDASKVLEHIFQGKLPNDLESIDQGAIAPLTYSDLNFISDFLKKYEKQYLYVHASQNMYHEELGIFGTPNTNEGNSIYEQIPLLRGDTRLSKYLRIGYNENNQDILRFSNHKPQQPPAFCRRIKHQLVDIIQNQMTILLFDPNRNNALIPSIRVQLNQSLLAIEG